MFVRDDIEGFNFFMSEGSGGGRDSQGGSDGRQQCVHVRV